jgi:hypothetical protein
LAFFIAALRSCMLARGGSETAANAGGTSSIVSREAAVAIALIGSLGREWLRRAAHRAALRADTETIGAIRRKYEALGHRLREGTWVIERGSAGKEQRSQAMRTQLRRERAAVATQNRLGTRRFSQRTPLKLVWGVTYLVHKLYCGYKQ